MIAEILKQMPVAGVPFLVLGLSLYAFVHKLDVFHSLLERRQRRTVDRINEALGSDTLNDEERRHLESELSNEYYRLTTGSRMPPRVRRAALEELPNCPKNITFRTFVSAQSHLDETEKEIRIKYGSLEKTGYWLLVWPGVLIALMGAVILGLPAVLYEQNMTAAAALALVAYGASYISGGVMLILAGAPFQATRALAKALPDRVQHVATLAGS